MKNVGGQTDANSAQFYALCTMTPLVSVTSVFSTSAHLLRMHSINFRLWSSGLCQCVMLLAVTTVSEIVSSEEDRGDTVLRNVGNHTQDYSASQHTQDYSASQHTQDHNRHLHRRENCSFLFVAVQNMNCNFVPTLVNT
jgi:hypothetical protein